MNVHYNLRSNTTTVPTTAPTIKRAVSGNPTPRWVGPLVLAALSAAAVVTVNQIRTNDDPTPATQSITQAESLIVPEERAFIDARTAPVSRVAVANSGFEPFVLAEERAFIDARTAPVSRVAVANSGFEPFVLAEEQAFIDARTAPVSGAAVSVSVGVEPLIGAEEQAFIDARTAPVSHFAGDVDWCISHKPC
jgi:hypothetical protein